MLKPSSYLILPSLFYQLSSPTAVSTPSLLTANRSLLAQLLPGLDDSKLVEMLSGNVTDTSFSPLALAYSGYQFGHLNSSLGDGRAHLLGEVESQGAVFDLQLKGSGRTAYSRRGDGRCALKPAVREYLMSEAMQALGVPTTRVLAVIATGEMVSRAGREPGAIVARVADSHLRFGTFHYAAIHGNRDDLEALLNYAVARHYPDLENLPTANKAAAFLRAVMLRQITTVTEWLRVGFIHGVMNTDNMTISGETIDYGPCAMLGVYDPDTVFSSIDHQGRYRFGQQPAILEWNLYRLAESLLDLLSDDQERAIKVAQRVLSEFDEHYVEAYRGMISRKLALGAWRSDDQILVDELLNLMRSEELDYTNTFLQLTHIVRTEQTFGSEAMQQFICRWRSRLDIGCIELMKQANPCVIPRNHHIEACLEAVMEGGFDLEQQELLTVLLHPYEQKANTHKFQTLPRDGDAVYQTYCGT